MTLLEFLDKNHVMIFESLLKHIELVLISVSLGVLIAVPLGIILTRHQKIAQYALTFVGLIQTVPGLVMLGIALMVFGIGFKPAIIVLTLYSLLPILRNTYTGIIEVDAGITEAARGIGMKNMQILLKVEIPLALATIVSGIRIATVYIVSWATLAGLIAAGGLGDLIWTGLSTYNTHFILAGAIPSAILAFTFSGLIGWAEKKATPRGLRRAL